MGPSHLPYAELYIVSGGHGWSASQDSINAFKVVPDGHSGAASHLRVAVLNEVSVGLGQLGDASHLASALLKVVPDGHKGVGDFVGLTAAA
jgi:hypothetical protein